MKASFKHFMTGLIDYAGLFPPASLDLETATGNFAGYLAGENGWMLGRCIVPAAQLHRVALHPGFCYSVIVSAAASEVELDRLGTFAGRVEMVETRLPETASAPDRCSEHLLHLESRLRQAGLQDVQLFVEAANVAPAAAAIAAFNNRRRGEGGIVNVGFKLRCGGLEKQAFPAPEKVAEVIGICRGHDIPIKFTAGMHRPLRNYAAELDVMQHGFINIFGAALLCWSHNLSPVEMTECLNDETAHHFHFTEEDFSWMDNKVSASEVERLRHSRAISFGSCSFTEPVDGLCSLGFLDRTGV